MPNLRTLHNADLPSLLLIEQATQAFPWSEAAFNRCREAKYPGWILELDNKIIGFILASIGAGECHVLNLAIHPSHQQQGYGTQLLTHLLKTAKQQGALMAILEVRRSNLNAIALYSKIDFVQIGERRNYYPSPKGHEDALVFAKDLGIE